MVCSPRSWRSGRKNRHAWLGRKLLRKGKNRLELQEREEQEKLRLGEIERQRIAKTNKYLECRYDPVTGGILYVPLNITNEFDNFSLFQ
jgi:hypothetical protein